MAFQDFDHISERRKNERKQKVKKRIIIASVSTIAVVLLIAAAICGVVYSKRQSDHSDNGSSSPQGKPPKEISQSQKAVQMICAPTDYKQTCETSLSKAVSSNSSTAAPEPKDLLKAAISVVANELKNAINHTSTFKFDTPQLKGAFEDCLLLLEDATAELNNSISSVAGQSLGKLYLTTPDLNNWLSAVMSYQQTCIDGFPEGELKSSLQKALNNARELTSNALAIINQVSSVFSKFIQAPPAANRSLLSHDQSSLDKDGLPTWMTHEDRRMLKAQPAKLTPNVIVAKDGSGKFTSISAALAAMPPAYQGRYVYATWFDFFRIKRS